MNKAQRQVEEFHRMAGQTVGDMPGMREVEVRRKLITEEFRELMEALDRGDMVAALDAIQDLKYVLIGTEVTWGINGEAFFDEVHRTNMLKKGGYLDENGKFRKPPGWEPPRIKELLEKAILEKTLANAS